MIPRDRRQTTGFWSPLISIQNIIETQILPTVISQPSMTETSHPKQLFSLFFKFIYLYWERESEQERERARTQMGEGQRERKTENPKQAPCCQHRAGCGGRAHKPRHHDLSRNQESDSWPTESPRRHNSCFLAKMGSSYLCCLIKYYGHLSIILILMPVYYLTG